MRYPRGRMSHDAREHSREGAREHARASASELAIARRLEELSVAEIVAAAGAKGAPALVRHAVELAARVPSRRLGRTLARFDTRIGEVGLGAAAREVLRTFGAVVDVSGSVPRTGGVLVITNHPGAYDALATLASLGRDDVALVAAERDFLRAMPCLTEHLVFVADAQADVRGGAPTLARAMGLRRALAWLEAGHALVQFGAGAIEPDSRFTDEGEDVLGVWSEGTSVLAMRALANSAVVVPALVSGVHSRRAKRLPIVRWAERRGITTVAPLVQATMPGFRDVAVMVRFGEPVDREALVRLGSHAARTALLRSLVAALAEVRPLHSQRRRNAKGRTP